MTLVAMQAARDREFGALVLAVWVHAQDDAEDVYLLEVFESFASPDDGAERAVLRFPAFGDLWLPGMYIVETMSRAEFDRVAAAGDDEALASAKEDLARGAAEILWPPPEKREPWMEL
ncbi:hypothetical protein CVU37_02515 [candidate division BRC1 bacterium HGW-BRC1-1]|jgi:hypothetical protein|nr:MAG: hypothetical protein CVU37_02515 [candidate division BRC1 bacterium HGW-BRC1-1]